MDKSPEDLAIGEYTFVYDGGRFDGLKVGRDYLGWYIGTWQQRSQSFPSLDAILDETIARIKEDPF